MAGVGRVQAIFEGDDANLIKSLDKQRAKLQQLEQKFESLKRKGKSAGDGISKGIGKGSGALSKMRKGFVDLVGPIASVGAAVGLVTKLIGEMNAERDRGAAMARDSFAGMQKLSQISNSPKEFRDLIRLSANISKDEGVPLNESMLGVFAGRSLNLTRGEIKSLAPYAQAADFKPIVEGVGDTFAAFGRGEAGSALSVANKTGVAAAVSKIGIAEFAPHLATIGKPAQMINVGDEEAMAALAYLSAGQGRGPEEGATQIKNLMTAIRKSPAKLGIRGAGSFAEMIDRISALPPDVRAKHFEANIRAAGGLAGMTEKLPQIRALTTRLREEERRTDAGAQDTYVKTTIGNFESLPLTRKLLAGRRSSETNKLSEMTALGEDRVDFETMRDRAYTQLREGDHTEIERFQGRLNMLYYRAKEHMGFDAGKDMREYIEDRTGADIRQPQDVPSLDRALRDDDTARKLSEAATNLRDASRGLRDFVTPDPNKGIE